MLELHVYYMKYKDQLVLTGKINDVGAYTRTNIPNSYRTGIELQGAVQSATWFKAAANFTLSKNKVRILLNTLMTMIMVVKKQIDIRQLILLFLPTWLVVAT